MKTLPTPGKWLNNARSLSHTRTQIQAHFGLKALPTPAKMAQLSEPWKPFCSLASWCVHDACMCVAWFIYICDMTHSYVWHDPLICVAWLVHMWDMTHLYLWRDSIILLTWLINMCDCLNSRTVTFSGFFVCTCTWLIHVCGMTHLYVWHDSSTCVTWLPFQSLKLFCSLASRCVHDSFMCATWLVNMCDMTHPYVWHDSPFRALESSLTCLTKNESCHSYVSQRLFVSLACLTKMSLCCLLAVS